MRRLTGVLLFQDACFEPQRRRARVVLVPRGRLFDLRPRLVQLCLRELDDRAQSEVVAFLRQIERVRRLRQEIVGQSETLKSGSRRQPGHAHIPRDAVFQISQ